MKIAKGAKVNLKGGTKVDAQLGGNVAEGLANLKTLQFIRNRTEGLSFDSKMDFVLAFRVHRITFEGDKVSYKLSTKGTSLLGDENVVIEMPKPKLEGDLSQTNAEVEAKREAVDFVSQAEDDDDIDWILQMANMSNINFNSPGTGKFKVSLCSSRSHDNIPNRSHG